MDNDQRDRCLQRWHDAGYTDSYIRFTRPMHVDGREWARRLGVGPDSVVIDLGCGEGKLLTALARHIGGGIGIDVSPHMVEPRGLDGVRIRTRKALC